MGTVLSTVATLAASTLLPVLSPVQPEQVPPRLETPEQSAWQPMERRIDLSAPAPAQGAVRLRFEEPAPVFKAADARWSASAQTPGISFGPVRLQTGGIPGERFRYASFRLNQTALFGANVAATVDRHAAKIQFNWPLGN
jgi:hypothetical protein